MKRRNPLALLIGWITIGLVTVNDLRAADAPTSATVTGQVSNAATHAYLEGAVVTIEGTNRMATTDREGRYQFNNVSAGTVTLSVGFTGLDTQRVALTVQSGQTVTRDLELTSEIYKLDKFTVAGLREGTARAETLQRQAPNVKNVLSSDAFGNIADGNIGDFLQRAPGITAVYVGNDVRAVSIRGVDANLNSVTVDGQQMATAQSSGLGRRFEFEQTSLANIETIEVTKAPTPDMESNSIGGSVNLVTKSAFDRAAARVFNYTIGLNHESRFNFHPVARWKQPIREYGPSLSFDYSDVIGEKKNIGISLNGTFESHTDSGPESIFDYQNQPVRGPAYLYHVRMYGPSAAPRTRLASGLSIDYRWSDQTTISFKTSYGFFHENDDVRRHDLTTTQTVATIDASGNRTGGGFIDPRFTENVTHVFASPSSTSQQNISSYDKSGRTYVLAPFVRHRFPGLDIDYTLNYSNAGNFYDQSQNRPKYNSNPKGAISLTLPNVGWIIDRTTNAYFPTVTQTEGPDLYSLKNYTGLLLTHGTELRGYDAVTTGKLNVRKDVDLALPTFFKVGGVYQTHSRKVWSDNRRYNFTGPDGVLGTSDDNVDIVQFADPQSFSEVQQGGWRLVQWISPYKVARHQKDRPELWKEDITYGETQHLQSRREITETITSAYAMGNVRLGHVSLLAGVRMEDTRVKADGPLQHLAPAEVARRAAWVGPVTDPEARRRVDAEWGGRVHATGHYRNYFPGVHLKYEPFAGLVTRASWSTGIGRPPFGNIIPSNTVNETTLRVSVSNPALKPQYSNNYDLTAEYYFKPQGMVSVGLFKKKIQDYIFTDTSKVIGGGANNGFDGLYEGYGLSTAANGGSANIQGVELNYQQQLVFLPGWTKGFGVFANYTYMETEGDYGGTVVLSTSQLAGFLNRTGNVGVNYRGYGFDMRVQMVWRGKYLTSNSSSPALVTYDRAKQVVDVQMKYGLSQRVSVFLNIQNIFMEPLNNLYRLYPERNSDYYPTPVRFIGGITGRL